MFEKALKERSKRKLLLIHLHATEQIKPLFEYCIRDQVMCLDEYFARQNYSDSNKEITDSLLNLAMRKLF
jgi:hypothetical protein